MQLITRRALLAAACLSLPLRGGAAAGGGGGPAPLPIAARIPSGSAVLAPAIRSEGALYFAGDRSVGALAFDGGPLLWRHDLRQGDSCVFRPRIGNDVVVGGSGEFLAGWRADDGVPLWRHQPQIRFGVPLADEHRIICGDGHRVVAVDARSGDRLWDFPTTADTLIAYAPAATADAILVGPGDGRLYALDKADGKLRWQRNGMAQWQYLRQLSFRGGVLVAGAYRETLHGLAPADGKELWSFNAGNFINSQFVTDEAAYLWSPTGWLYAIDISTGKVAWRHRTTDYRASAGNWGPVMAELAGDEHHLYALDMRDLLHVLSRADGRELARFKVPTGCRPFVVPLPGGRVALGSRDGDLLIGMVGNLP